MKQKTIYFQCKTYSLQINNLVYCVNFVFYNVDDLSFCLQSPLILSLINFGPPVYMISFSLPYIVRGGSQKPQTKSQRCHPYNKLKIISKQEIKKYTQADVFIMVIVSYQQPFIRFIKHVQLLEHNYQRNCLPAVHPKKYQGN